MLRTNAYNHRVHIPSLPPRRRPATRPRRKILRPPIRTRWAKEPAKPSLLPSAEVVNKKIGLEARGVIDVLQRAGHSTYLIGSWVRIVIRDPKETPKKILIATDAKPDEIKSLFPEVRDKWAKYGNVAVKTPSGKAIAVSTMRKDGPYTDHRHPTEVTFTDNIHVQLERLNFTIEAIAYDLASGEFIDPYEGARDIRKKKIKTIGDPKKSFSQDALRALDGICLAAELKFTLGPGIADAIRETLYWITRIPRERKREFLLRVLRIAEVSRAFNMLLNTGTLVLISDYLERTVGFKQGKTHDFDLDKHLFLTCQYLPTTDPLLRLAGLFHDIGKLDSRGLNPRTRRQTFTNHDKIGAQMTREIMGNLLFSVRDIDRVVNLVRHHMFTYGKKWTDADIRFFLLKIGETNIADFIELRRADHKAHREIEEIPIEMDEFNLRLTRLLAREGPPSRIKLALDGHAIMKILGLKQGGIVVGQEEHILMDMVLVDPTMNTPDKLAAILRQKYQ